MLMLGDVVEDAVIDFKWGTNDASGASITRATDGTVSVYKGNNTTQSTAGVTDTEDFDGITGVHNARIDTSADAFYEPGYDYAVVLSGATIDGETVNAPLAHFSIENRRMRGTDNALTTLGTNAPAGWINEAAFANDAISDAKVAADVTIAGVTGAVGSVTGNVGGSVASVVGAVGSVTGDVGGNVTGTIGGLATQAKADVNAEVDTALTDYDAPTRSEATSDKNEILTRLGTPDGDSVSEDIAAVKADTSSLVSRITATLFSGITSLASWLGALAGKTADTATRSEIAATTAGAGYNETTDSLQAISDSSGGGGGSSLTGPYTRTITIEDAADDSPVENATVRLYRTGETETQLSDADGETEFTVEAATWSYAVTASGYAGATGTIVVSDNGATTIQLTATAITPPVNPSLSAIEVLCVDSAGQPEEGVNVDIRIVSIPSGSVNYAFKGAKQTATSDGDGIARFEVVQSATYEWKRGLADVWQKVVIDPDGVTNVTSVIGSP